MADCSAPLGVARRDREGLEGLWGNWVRLMGFLESGQIPDRFQRKPYYPEVLQWHRFHVSVLTGSSEEIETRLLHASQANPESRPRRRRKRRKNKGLQEKPPNFS
jgi:hypothetical protein